MSQNDQNRDRENQSEGYQDQTSEELREGRSGSQDDSQRQDQGSISPAGDDSSDLEDTDEMEDDDREDDDRIGGQNRRRSIS